MTEKLYSTNVKDLKRLLNTLPLDVEDFSIVFEDGGADYIEIDEIDYDYKIVFFSGYYLNYN